jgi:hypothetical protein
VGAAARAKPVAYPTATMDADSPNTFRRFIVNPAFSMFSLSSVLQNWQIGFLLLQRVAIQSIKARNKMFNIRTKLAQRCDSQQK